MAEENVRNTQVRCMRTTQFLKITAGSTYELPLSFKQIILLLWLMTAHYSKRLSGNYVS